MLPIDSSGLERMVAEKPLVAPPRDRYTYRPGTQSIPFFAGPRVLNRPHSITATVEIPDDGAEGVLLCQGTAAGGYTMFLKDGKLHYVHNYVGRSLHRRVLPDTVQPAPTSCASSSNPPGHPTCPTAEERRDGCSSTSTARSSLTQSAEVTTPFMLNPGALTCGANPGSPVTPDYPSPFRFTGTLHKVDRRRVRRAHHRQRERAADGHGPPVAAQGSSVNQRILL